MKTHRLTLLYCETPNQMCNGTKIKMYLSIIYSYPSARTFVCEKIFKQLRNVLKDIENVQSLKSISPTGAPSLTNGSSALLQSSPLHPSQAATHFNPLFRQEHKFVPCTFLEENLHLHRMITRRFSGATSLSVNTGNNRLLTFFQTLSSGLCTHSSNVFHNLT